MGSKPCFHPESCRGRRSSSTGGSGSSSSSDRSGARIGIEAPTEINIQREELVNARRRGEPPRQRAGPAPTGLDQLPLKNP
ncbi:MAG: carbon storage regulator [Gemmatimonadetes bacterium]|nr:carbon storage regulator [Gemmatimonadota bacterium]